MSQFPELQTVSGTFVLACQALGGALLAAMICLLALMIFTAFGNEHRLVYARLAALGIILGFALLMAAPAISRVVQRIFPLH